MIKGTLRNVVGDATDPQLSSDNEIAVIPHVCNDSGGWGKGFVLALSKKWKLPENSYRKLDKYELGNIQWNWVENFKITVVNMIAQHGYISQDNPRPLKYDALIECMNEVKNNIININDNKRYVIHCCKFGSDLARGNWDFIVNLIEDIWLNNGIDVVVYEYKG